MSRTSSFTPSQLATLEILLSPFLGVQSLEASPGNCADTDDGDGNQPEPTLGTNKDDLLQASAGNDNLVGLNGDDTIRASQGKDWLYGDNGNDFLDGGPGRDFLYGGNGNDELRGGQGRDDLFGENGNDVLIGGCGPDLMNGGRGNDVLFGGNASDTYTGGLGQDVFVLALPGGQAAITALAKRISSTHSSMKRKKGISSPISCRGSTNLPWQLALPTTNCSSRAIASMLSSKMKYRSLPRSRVLWHPGAGTKAKAAYWLFSAISTPRS